MSLQKVRLSDGANVSVKILGDPSPDRPLLIVLHGAPGLSTHDEPEASFGFLSTKFRVLVFDARGSGSSDLKPPYTNARWVADIDELRIWASAEKILLAGGSYGGMLALEYALAHGDRLLGLILRDAFAWGQRTTLHALKNILLSGGRIRPDPDRQVRLWAGATRDDDDFADAFNEIAAIYEPEEKPEGAEAGNSPSASTEQAPPGDLARVPESGDQVPTGGAGAGGLTLHHETHNFAFAHNMPNVDLRPRLREIAAPTLVAVGRHDLITPPAWAEEIRDALPSAQLAVFEHSGHTPSIDEPEAFRNTVHGFLSQLGF